MKKIFKTLFSLLVVLGLVSVAVACGGKTEEKSEEPTTEEQQEQPREKNTYHVVGGHFNDWSDYTDANKMTKISVDELDASLKAKLLNKDVTAVLKLEGREFNADYAWTTPAYVNEKAVDLDGGYTIKVVYAEYDEADDTTFAKQWCPDPKTAAVQNLTPETLFVPKWVETPAAGEEHLGKWDQNPVVTAGAGKYTVYFVEYAGANSADSPKYAMAVVKTQELEENVRKEFDVLSTLATADDVYTLEVKDGAANIAVEKKAGTEWASLQAPVSDVAHMKSLRFTISGDCVVKLKVESSAGGKEVDLELGAEPTAYEWNLGGEDEQKILAGENVKFVLFVLPNMAEGKGNVVLTNVKFSVDKAMFNPIESGFTNIKPVEVPATPEGKEEFAYDGTSETFNINQNWSKLDADKDTYAFEEVENGVKVSYKVDNWQFAKTMFWGDYRKFTHVTIKVTGTAGQKLLVKAEGNGNSFAVEERFTFNGSEQVLSLDLSGVKESLRAAGYSVLLVGNDGQGGEGSFIIHELYLGSSSETNLGAPVFERPNPEVYWTGDTFSPLNGTWYSGGQAWGDYHSEGTDKFTWNAETKTVSFADRTGEYGWSVFGVDVRGNFANFSKLTYKFTATEGLKVKFLVIHGTGFKELQEVVATGAEQTVELDLSVLTADERSSIRRIGFFTGYQLNSADTDYTPTGEVKLHAVDFGGYASTTKTGADSFECKYFFDFRGPVQNYLIHRADNKTVVNFDKQAGSEWEGMVCFLDGNLAGYTTLNYDVELSEGAFITIKIEGSKNVELKLDGDATVKATGTGSIDLTAVEGMAEALAGAQKVIVFINLGQAKVKGTVTINSLTFTK